MDEDLETALEDKAPSPLARSSLDHEWNVDSALRQPFLPPLAHRNCIPARSYISINTRRPS